jgi:hypothetical protein
LKDRRWRGRGKYLIPGIDSRERALELSNLLVITTSTTAQQIIIITVLYERSVVVASCELVCVVAQQRLLAG